MALCCVLIRTNVPRCQQLFLRIRKKTGRPLGQPVNVKIRKRTQSIPPMSTRNISQGLRPVTYPSRRLTQASAIVSNSSATGLLTRRSPASYRLMQRSVTPSASAVARCVQPKSWRIWRNCSGVIAALSICKPAQSGQHLGHRGPPRHGIASARLQGAALSQPSRAAMPPAFETIAHHPCRARPF